MSDPAELAEADRWQQEADEELQAALVIAAHREIPGRVAGFHAHLAAEKALKALLIRRGVVLRRIHDLVELQRLLPADDGARFVVDDLEMLNPWTIDGRYPADVGEASVVEITAAVDAAARVVEAARRGWAGSK
ncbi:MAG: HEPN domain-containing protein [Acidimicrobiales bacterium]